MYLHIMRNDKFLRSFILFIEKNFLMKDHVFIFNSGISSKELPIVERKNVIVTDSKLSLLKKILFFYRSDKIYLHGLFNPSIVLLLFIQPWLLKKCNWIVWGGDLYLYQQPKVISKQKLYEFIRAFCIKRVGGLITHVKGDYELAQKWYGATGGWFDCFVYPSNLYKEIDISKVNKDQNKIYIQVGNSADQTNNHFDILDKLKKFKNENIEIICPLSYGNSNHAKKVKEYGEKLFGKKFVALTEFLPFEEYLNVLGKIDIAIFNHKRQQAMGNMTTLLGLGKKVYIKKGTTNYSFYKKEDITIFNSNEEIDLERISTKDSRKNILKIKNRFSEERLKEDLKTIFEN